MNTDDINTSTEEPVAELARRGVHGDNEVSLEPEIQERLRRLQSDLPWWFEEKFHWHASPSGFMRLRPNENFLKAVQEDAPKFELYGKKLNSPDSGSPTTEADLIEAIATGMLDLVESARALEDREYNAVKRFVIGRCTDNCVYAAITQFEIDQWTARAAARGADAREHENFGEKESRRDGFAAIGAVWGNVARQIFDDHGITDATFVKAANSTIYTQADMRGRELLNPQQEEERDTAAVQAAVAVSRPI